MCYAETNNNFCQSCQKFQGGSISSKQQTAIPGKIFCLLFYLLMFYDLSHCLSVYSHPSILDILLSICPVRLSISPFVCLSVRPSVCPCLSVKLSVLLSVCPSVCPCLPVHLSVQLNVCPSVSLSICLSVHLSVHLSVRLSGHPSILSVHLSVHQSVRLSGHPSICPSICPFICLSVLLSICLSIPIHQSWTSPSPSVCPSVH
jgi:hypothetical protein